MVGIGVNWDVFIPFVLNGLHDLREKNRDIIDNNDMHVNCKFDCIIIPAF